MIKNSKVMENRSALSNPKQTPTQHQRSRGKWGRCAILAVLGLAAASLTGCVGRFTGGGAIDSLAGAPQKATFGFVINAINPDEAGNPTAITGQFQFDDHGAGVSFHVDQFEPALYARIYPDIFAPDPAVMFAYHGTYSCAAGTGELDLGVSSHDQGVSVMSNLDAVFVEVSSGPYAGYSNVGLVQKGQISFFPSK